MSNKITLPKTLCMLIGNKVINIEIPDTLTIPIDWFPNGKFNLSFYQSIQRFQWRIRYRFKRQRAAKVIQRGCHN